MRVLSILGAASVLVLSSGWAHAESVVIRIASWAPPSHGINAHVLPTWAKWVAEATQGRVTGKIEYPQVPPPNMPDLVADGGADMSWIFHGYNPGRYMLQQVVELPGLGTNAEAASVASWRVFQKHLAKGEEHKGTIVIGMTSHGAGVLHTREPITKLSQIEGLKIRVPGGIGTEVVKLLGAQGVGVPAPKVYETLAQGVADGVVMPFETKKSFKLFEVAPATLMIPGGMYYGSFAFVLNPDTFAKLSKEDQAALMSISGEKLSALAGAMWDKADDEAAALVKEKKLPMLVAGPEMTAEYFNIVGKLETEWVAKASQKGVDGKAAAADMRAFARGYKSN